MVCPIAYREAMTSYGACIEEVDGKVGSVGLGGDYERSWLQALAFERVVGLFALAEVFG
jgi:hypothetical protein